MGGSSHRPLELTGRDVKAPTISFSDGVTAILATITVLELKILHGANMQALAPLCAVFLGYVLSFSCIGIYWNKLQYGHYPLFLSEFGCAEFQPENRK
jgi:hypothetical protein